MDINNQIQSQTENNLKKKVCKQLKKNAHNYVLPMKNI